MLDIIRSLAGQQVTDCHGVAFDLHQLFWTAPVGLLGFEQAGMK